MVNIFEAKTINKLHYFLQYFGMNEIQKDGLGAIQKVHHSLKRNFCLPLPNVALCHFFVQPIPHVIN